MEKPVIYETDGGLGYKQIAYLIRIENDLFLVIDKNCETELYQIGETVQLEEFYVSKSNYKLHNSPIFNDYLFKYFLNTHKYEKQQD